MDKFPEAFRRFERVVDTHSIHSFMELEMAFGSWAGRNWHGTHKQIEALKVEAWKRGIIPREHVSTRKRRVAVYRVETTRTWRHETIKVRGKPQSRYRDLKTGRFVKKPY